MRVLVCGGRDYNDQKRVSNILTGIGPTAIIHGNASGADECADRWALANEIPVLPFAADWGRFGKAAGPLRNQKMLDDGKPDLVVAFPGGRGTADMVAKARKSGVLVMEIAAKE